MGRLLVFLLAVSSALPAAAQRLPLQARAEAILGSDARWSAYAYSLDRRTPLFSIRADELRVPASNNKVFTGIWALDELGPDYRFPTDLLLAGPIVDGVLKGDVVLRGSGDPAFGYPAFEVDPMDPLRTTARRLRALGIQRVEGGVIADATVFDDTLFGPEWPNDTGNGVSRYAPRVSGLSFQRNLLRVQVIPVRGGKPRVETSPRTTAIPVVSTVGSGGGRAWATREPDSDTIRVRGSVSGRGSFRYEIGVARPALLAGEALREALEESGITVADETRTGETPPGAQLVHRHFSIRLAEMIPELNRHSDNFFAEHLWKAAAARAVGQGSYALGAPRSAIHFARRTAMPYGELWQADGSGLSAENRTTARALVAALAYAHRRPWAPLYHSSLALAGDPHGTLRRLFRGTAAAGNLHAKTGYIRGVRTLSGYVRTRGGENVAFSFLYNGNNTSGARSVQQELGTLLASYGAPAAAAAPATAAADDTPTSGPTAR
jgi:D-alanyl-D-alanine carboxypeptidase/D-alanyl-D-alanine-endopeptidase (penicillin-binding protein 4)